MEEPKISIEAKTPKDALPRVVSERVRRLLGKPPGTVMTLADLDAVPPNQVWKVEEARLKQLATDPPKKNKT